METTDEEAHQRPNESLDEFILRLQMQELKQVVSNSKGKQREGTANDFDLALQLFQLDLNALLTCQDDSRMAQSIAEAVYDDRKLIQQALDQETMAANDHKVAKQLSARAGAGILDDPSDECISRSEKDDKKLDPCLVENTERKLLAQRHGMRMRNTSLYPSVTDHRISYAESSGTAAARKPIVLHQKKSSSEPFDCEKSNCTACRETYFIFELAKLPCDDNYCSDCLSELFRLSMTDESLFPPRCCRQTIVFEYIRMFLEPKLVIEFENKKEELETPDKTYCHDRECQTFIPPNNIQHEVGTCPKCHEETCVMCKDGIHSGQDCPQDQGLNQLLAMADEQGWKRCPRCRRVVELTFGCNHIRCNCGAQFCYECNAIWKTCHCEVWTEERLMRRAEAIQIRQGNQRPQIREDAPPDPGQEPPGIQLQQQLAFRPAARGPVFAGFDDSDSSSDDEDVFGNRRPVRGLQQIMNEIRENHVCEHRQWKYIAGPHRCEECTHRLPQYIFECRQCKLRACWRCRKNRLMI